MSTVVNYIMRSDPTLIEPLESLLSLAKSLDDVGSCGNAPAKEADAAVG